MAVCSRLACCSWLTSGWRSTAPLIMSISPIALLLGLFVFGGPVAGGLGVRFAHIFSVLGLAVPAFTFVVIDLGVGVHPHLSVASAGLRGRRIALRQARCLRGASVVSFSSTRRFWLRGFVFSRTTCRWGFSRIGFSLFLLGRLAALFLAAGIFAGIAPRRFLRLRRFRSRRVARAAPRGL